MGNTLYLECYSGISGDMTVAALLDLGAEQEVLKEVLDSLPVQGFQTAITRVKKSGIDVCDFDVLLDADHDNHDHDMDYLHGSHEHAHEGEDHHSHGDHEHVCSEENHHSHGVHEHVHEDENHHIHDNEHAHEEHHSHGAHEHAHPHEHRGMKEIKEIIAQGKMTENARSIALNIFEVLAQAEAKAHQVPVEEVHFHEVGAVDSIVDILSVAVCLDNLNITEVIVPVLYEGTGTIRCQHGILPVPVPAVANLIAQHGLKVKITEVKGELVTPTGAAIVAAVKTKDQLPENFQIEKIGIGAGKRQYECPGILRAMLLQPGESKGKQNLPKDVIYKLESNIDDCSGETLGYLMGQLMEAGARDVHYVPAFMKKNRPAWILYVICKEEDIARLEEIIFRETTTIGIRRVEMERSILLREQRTIHTPMGDIQMKICDVYGEKRFYPEYNSLVSVCKKSQISYAQAYAYAVQFCEEEGRQERCKDI